MSRKAVCEIEIPELGMPSDHRVLVEAVVVVMADPGIDHLDRLESRHPRRKPRPDPLLEPAVIDLPIERLRLLIFWGRQTADEMHALGTEVEAGGIDGERRPMEGFRGLVAIEDIDIALARADRQRHA